MDVRVEPVRLDWVEALIAGDEVFARQFAIPVVDGWMGFPDALAFVLEAVRRHDGDPWGSHLFFDSDGALVGLGGFKGAPCDGHVEIGYAVAPARQGRGVATAAARVLIDRARRAGVVLVVAHTLAEFNASTAVLDRCGFCFVSTVADPDGGVDDDVWRWELQLQ